MAHPLVRHGLALLSGFVGLAGVYGLLIVLNETAQGLPEADNEQVVEFIVPPPPPPPPQQVQRPRPRPRPRPQAPPAPLLATSLAGLDLGLGLAGADVLSEMGSDFMDNAEDVVMTEASVDAPATPRSRPPGRYPARARERGVEGWVRLRLLVDEQGGVSRVQLEAAEPAGVFDEAAIETVQRWSFAAATYEGRPVRSWVRQTVRFRLEAGGD